MLTLNLLRLTLLCCRYNNYSQTSFLTSIRLFCFIHFFHFTHSVYQRKLLSFLAVSSIFPSYCPLYSSPSSSFPFSANFILSHHSVLSLLLVLQITSLFSLSPLFFRLFFSLFAFQFPSSISNLLTLALSLIVFSLTPSLSTTYVTAPVISLQALTPLLTAPSHSIRSAAAATVSKLSIKAKAFEENSSEISVILNTVMSVLKAAAGGGDKNQGGMFIRSIREKYC